MTNPRALLDAYAEIPNMGIIPLPFSPGTMAPLAFDALRAVLELHKPVTIDGITFCPACRQTSYPCGTATAITTALEAP